MKLLSLPLALSFLILTSAYAGAPGKIDVTLMAYNIENLFDTKHDEGKEDFTYLPLSVKKASKEVIDYCRSIYIPVYRKDCFELDWNEKILKIKIKNMAKVVKSFNNGKGPDILVLEEVENIKALTQFKDQGLSSMNYQSIVLIEGPDKRGIDVAILARFPLVDSKIHHVRIDPNNSQATRPILEATFTVHGKPLTVFGNHWPSQMNPDEDRISAAEVLAQATSALTHRNVIAVGDFNTLDNDDKNGLKEITLNSEKEIFYYDVNSTKKAPQRFPGSHCYRGRWAFLDKILVVQGPENKVTEASFSLYAPDFILKPDPKSKKGELIPNRFDEVTGQGYSDHLPITILFKF
jgi:endonuclease/exonuclease/phosphatase family metal-dependent hydrolase